MTTDLIRKSNSGRQSPAGLIAIVVLGMTGAILLSGWIDKHRPPANAAVEEEQLYVNGRVARYMSLGFNGLVADWYWMRSLQYVGGKILNAPTDVELDDLSQLNLKLLAPLLDVATTIDPEFLEPYEYAAIVLPSVDMQQAIRITKKGIDANPTAWPLYHQLGYIYWQQSDFQAASEAYGLGAMIPDAPPWMEAMKARMAAEGGSRDTAREIYTRMFEQSGDPKVKEMAQRRILQVYSLEQRDVLRKVLGTYRDRTGHCPSSWKDLGTLMRTLRFSLNESGAPLDPSGAPYVLRNSCDVDLDPKSQIPYN